MRRLGWVASGAVAIAAIVAAWRLWNEPTGIPPHSSRSSHRASSAGSFESEGASSDGSDAASPDAERSLEATTPVPVGATRFRVKFVRAGGSTLPRFPVVARPDGATDERAITPDSNGEARLDLDDSCGTVDFAMKGFVDVHHVVDASERDRGDLGTIVFTPAALLDVRIVGAPCRITPWLEIGAWARLEVGHGRRTGFSDNAKVATPDGTANVRFALPSDLEVGLGLDGKGVAIHSTPPPLAAGTTTWTIDLASCAHIRGRVVGVPPVCARGSVVWLQCFVAEQDGLFPGMDARVDLDDEARFEFLAVPDGAFALRVDAFLLREPGGAHRATWRTADLSPDRELDLEFDREMRGVEVGPISAEQVPTSGDWLRFDDAKQSYATLRRSDDGRVSRGLVLANALREAAHAVIAIGTSPARVVDVAPLPPPRDGVVTVDLDQFPPPRGRLTISWNWFASRDWKLELTAAGRRVGDPPGAPPAKRDRGWFGETFDGLAPGTYDVRALWKPTLARRVASGIDLGVDEERRVDVNLPTPTRRAGRVTNWSDLEPAMRPFGICFESATSADIKNGFFETDVVAPIGRTARFLDLRHENVDVSATIETDEDGTLAVRFPVDEVELFVLTAQLAPDEHAWARCVGEDAPESVGNWVIDRWSPPRRATADDDGRMTFVRKRGTPLHGWIDGLGPQGAKRTLAWFSSDVPTGTIVPAGRYVDVSDRSDGAVATLYLVARPVADWTPPRLALCKLIHALPRRLWIPDGAQFIDVEFPERPRQRVDCATIGATWEIDAE